MILLDTNVLIDAFDPSARLHEWASDLIRQSLLGEGIAINAVILAELCVGDHMPDTVAERLEKLGFVILDLPSATGPAVPWPTPPIWTTGANKPHLKPQNPHSRTSSSVRTLPS